MVEVKARVAVSSRMLASAAAAGLRTPPARATPVSEVVFVAAWRGCRGKGATRARWCGWRGVEVEDRERVGRATVRGRKGRRRVARRFENILT